MKKWLTVILVLFSTFAMAQSEEKLDVTRKKNLDTFFSNFSEANVQSFKKGSLSDEALLNFALTHNYINNFKALKKSADGRSLIVPAGSVDKTTLKYFGLKIDKHPKGDYPVPLADGEAYTFSQISRLVNRGGWSLPGGRGHLFHGFGWNPRPSRHFRRNGRKRVKKSVVLVLVFRPDQRGIRAIYPSRVHHWRIA